MVKLMSVKNNVLKLLEENRGVFLSGEKMADSLKVSRTAIWKAMRALQNEGYSIDAVTNKGYMLREDSSMLSKEGIELYLKSGTPLYFFHSTDSTNKRAAALALEGPATVPAQLPDIRPPAEADSAEAFTHLKDRGYISR